MSKENATNDGQWVKVHVHDDPKKYEAFGVTYTHSGSEFVIRGAAEGWELSLMCRKEFNLLVDKEVGLKSDSTDSQVHLMFFCLHPIGQWVFHSNEGGLKVEREGETLKVSFESVSDANTECGIPKTKITGEVCMYDKPPVEAY